jgi:hypothetical protein
MIDAMKQALEALENGKRVRANEGGTKYQPDLEDAAIATLRQAIEQAEKQKPVGIHCPSCLHSFAVVPVAKREWVGLTDEEIDYIWGISPGDWEDKFAFPRAIEAKLKEKNGG